MKMIQMDCSSLPRFDEVNYSKALVELLGNQLRSENINPDAIVARYFDLRRLSLIKETGTDRDDNSPHTFRALNEQGIKPVEYTYAFPIDIAYGDMNFGIGTHGIAIYSLLGLELIEYYTGTHRFLKDPKDCLEAIIIKK